jgi:hypothetical protein
MEWITAKPDVNTTQEHAAKCSAAGLGCSTAGTQLTKKTRSNSFLTKNWV